MLDAEQQFVQLGEAGEIYFGGQMSDGYLNRPEETARRFLRIPHISSGTVYRTGDLGRLGPVKELELLGRVDRQLNIRGVRLEPESVEAVLRTKVQHALVVGARGILVACVGPKDACTTEDILWLCKNSLPSHAVPRKVLWMEIWPLLANGKTDVKRLQAHADASVNPEADDLVFATDSLGVMRAMQASDIKWQRVCLGCYGFWSFGVVLDHWMDCQINAHSPEMNHNLCYNVGMLVPAWLESTLRSIGGDQDVVGFLLLAAIIDSKKPALLGSQELSILIVYFACFFFFPVLTFLDPWTIETDPLPLNVHRWYLYAYLLARLMLACFAVWRVPKEAQCAVMTLLMLCVPEKTPDLCRDMDSVSFRVGAALFPSYCGIGESTHSKADKRVIEAESVQCVCRSWTHSNETCKHLSNHIKSTFFIVA